jgi:hypothetical protein
MGHIGKFITIDPELESVLNDIRDKLKTQGHSNASYSNAIRTLGDLPHNACSCEVKNKTPGRTPMSSPKKRGRLKTLLSL